MDQDTTNAYQPITLPKAEFGVPDTGGNATVEVSKSGSPDSTSTTVGTSTLKPVVDPSLDQVKEGVNTLTNATLGNIKDFYKSSPLDLGVLVVEDDIKRLESIRMQRHQNFLAFLMTKDPTALTAYNTYDEEYNTKREIGLRNRWARDTQRASDVSEGARQVADAVIYKRIGPYQIEDALTKLGAGVASVYGAALSGLQGEELLRAQGAGGGEIAKFKAQLESLNKMEDDKNFAALMGDFTNAKDTKSKQAIWRVLHNKYGNTIYMEGLPQDYTEINRG